MSNTNPAAVPSNTSFSRPAAMIGGAVALIALTAVATTLVMRPSAPSGQAAGTPVAAQALLPAPEKTAQIATPNDAAAEPAPAKEAAPPVKAAAPRPVAAKPAPRPVAKPAVSEAAPERVAAAPVAPACTTCGVVEAVTPFEQKGEASGVGAVAGGVLGGVLGHQVGGGNGKKAMTVLGAIGGGMAGHEIEKRQRATTMYSVKVRMEDGTMRTITQSTAPTVGQKVTVEGSQIKARA